MNEIKITPEELAKSAGQYRKELLQVPVRKLGAALRFFTVRAGLRESETVGELSGNVELHPYSEDDVDSDDVTVAGRKLELYKCNVVKQFSPNSVLSSIYGSNIIQGDGLKNVPITVQILAMIMAKIGAGIGLHLFDAKYDATGKTTSTCFQGIDTITAADIASGLIAEDKGNLFNFSEAITRDNAVDQLLEYVRSASDVLIGFEDGDVDPAPGSGLNLILPRAVYNAYIDDYKQTTGHSPIYDKFNQLTLEGFSNVRLVPLAGKANSEFLQLTTKSNLLFGCNALSDVTNIDVIRSGHYKVSAAATMLLGTNYESVAAERLHVGKIVKS